MAATLLRQIDLRHLLEKTPALCVSLFQPTHRTGRELGQDPIQFKNLLREARKQIKPHSEEGPRESEVLLPAEALLQDETFWQHQSDGLAVFCGNGECHEFRVPMRFEPLAIVGRQYFIKPLLPAINGDGLFYLLALTRESARLYQATRDQISRVSLPEHFEAPQPELNQRPTLQFHSQPDTGAGDTGAGRPTPMFHGQGAPDDEQSSLKRFFQEVEDAVWQEMRDERAPLLLACVGYLKPIYKSVNRYRYLLDEKVPGSPDRWSLEQLHHKAWSLVQPRFTAQLDEALGRFPQAQSKNLASASLPDVVLGAHDGRVESLFVARGRKRFGVADFPRRAIHVEADDVAEPKLDHEELLNLACVDVLRHGGEVFVVEPDRMPSPNALAAAVFRYPA